MFDAMEKRELDAKKLVPLLAEQAAIAARQGDAVFKAMENNRSQMQRLKNSLTKSAITFFEAGFGKELSSIFKDLSKSINESKPVIILMGKATSKVMEGIRGAFAFVHDIILFITLVTTKLANNLGIPTETLKSWAGLAGNAVGVGLFAGAVWKLGGALKWLLGMPLKGLVSTLSRLAALGGVAGVGAIGAGAGGVAGTSIVARGAGLLGKFLGPAGLAYMGYDAIMDGHSPLGKIERGDVNARLRLDNNQYSNPFDKQIDSIKATPGLLDVFDEWGKWAASLSQSNKTIATPYNPLSQYNPMGLMPGSNGYRIPVDVSVSVSGEAVVRNDLNINDGQITGLVTNAIRDSETRGINMILGMAQ